MLRNIAQLVLLRNKDLLNWELKFVQGYVNEDDGFWVSYAAGEIQELMKGYMNVNVDFQEKAISRSCSRFRIQISRCLGLLCLLPGV